MEFGKILFRGKHQWKVKDFFQERSRTGSRWRYDLDDKDDKNSHLSNQPQQTFSIVSFLLT